MMYSLQALIICPDHRAAGANRQRVRSAVEELDNVSLRRIDLKRDTVATIPDSNPALRRAKKEAYFQVNTFTKLNYLHIIRNQNINFSSTCFFGINQSRELARL